MSVSIGLTWNPWRVVEPISVSAPSGVGSSADMGFLARPRVGAGIDGMGLVIGTPLASWLLARVFAGGWHSLFHLDDLGLP